MEIRADMPLICPGGMKKMVGAVYKPIAILDC